MNISSLTARRAIPDRVTLSQNKKKKRSPEEKYLHDLLSDVAGKELHRAGVQLDVSFREFDKPYELRGDRLLIHPELLFHLQSREEVAFVLAQQAAFAIEEHSSQEIQFGADQRAIGMMAEAGFNPGGALSALEKIYQHYPSQPEAQGLELVAKTAASQQEHEGVRIAAAQLTVEQMRRSGHPALKAASTALPAFVKQEGEFTLKSPTLKLETSADHMIERACEKLKGKSYSTRVEGLLEAVLLAAKNGLLHRQGTKDSTDAQVLSLLGTEDGTQDNSTELHKEFLKTLVGSNSLKGLLHPLRAPWQKLIQNLADKRGRFGLPEGMLLVNELMGTGLVEDVPRQMVAVREEIALKKLRPPYQKPQELDPFLHELFQSESWAPFEPEFEERLPDLLLNFVRTSQAIPGFQYAPGAPQALHPGLERRLHRLLRDQALSAKDRKAIVTYLHAHWDDDQSRSTGINGKRWAASLAPHLDDPAAFLRPEDTPNESLAADIAALFEDDELKLQQLNLPKLKELATKRTPASEPRKARKEARRVERERRARIRFQATVEARQTLGPLAVMGENREALKKLHGVLDVDSFEQLLSRAETAVERTEILHRLSGEQEFQEHVGVNVGRTIMHSLLVVQDEVPELEDWYQLASRSIAFCSPALEACGARRPLGDELWKRLEKLEPEERSRWLRRPYVGHLLGRAETAEILLQEIGCSADADPKTLATAIKKLEAEFQLQERRPGLYRALRREVSLKARLQPATVDLVFPPDTRTKIEKADDLQTPIAGLSALVALSRQQPAGQQLEIIEYLMGRTKKAPRFVRELNDSQGFLPLVEMVQNVRQELKTADMGMRLLVADSFLAGPSGLMRSEEGRRTLLDHFLGDVRAKSRGLVESMANAVLKSQGDADSLAIAAILAQPPHPGKGLTEGEMLSSFFDAYGVPGIKMKQYLAFTSTFEKHQEAFASSQDNAMPLDHYQALKLLTHRFGGRWPEHLRVESVLGNGSVNVAIKCLNTEAGESEIVSVNRQDIRKQTEYDFERFRKLFEALTEKPEDRAKFGFVLGLMKVVKDSVNLEFDRAACLEVQKTAFKTYDHHIDGWHIKSIDAHRADNQSLFMQEAKGQTARKLKSQDPECYKQAMTAMHKAEVSVLRGQPSQGDVRPQALFANPDFHDGQVLIDSENKTVTILDFGQAVPITNDERELALDLLTVFAGIESAKKASKRLNKRFFPQGERKLTASDLEPLLARKKPMGRFIHLLSHLSTQGAKVPISSVHWLLGLNRQLSLGKRLGVNIESQLTVMVGAHKLGLGLGTANRLNAISKAVGKWTAALASVPGGLFGC